MKSFAAILALAGAVAAVPAATTTTAASNPDLTPTASAPSGCSTNYDGSFEISVVNASTVSKRSMQKRTALVATLKDGILTDAEGRTGEIVANYQFQFDPVIQSGAIYTAGWSVCENDTLALGGSAVFYECLSGTFYNLYDESTGAQCTQIFIDVIPVDSTTSSTSLAASQVSDGQVQATTAIAAVVSQITDGQIQATTGVQVVSQISDGQIQATTATSATSAVVVSQISDGQIQATTATTSGAVVSQISDGQIQATSVGTISATSARNATTPTVAAVSATVSAYTGAAAQATAGLFSLAAGVVALAFL